MASARQKDGDGVELQLIDESQQRPDEVRPLHRLLLRLEYHTRPELYFHVALRCRSRSAEALAIRTDPTTTGSATATPRWTAKRNVIITSQAGAALTALPILIRTSLSPGDIQYAFTVSAGLLLPASSLSLHAIN